MTQTKELGKNTLTKLLSKNKLIIQTVWLFLFLNNISFVFSPNITTTRVILLSSLTFVILIGKFRCIEAKQLYLIIFCLSLGLFNYLISLNTASDPTQFSRLTHFALYSIIAVVVYLLIFKDEITFHKGIVAATFIQIIFVFITYSSLAANNIIFSFIYVSHGFLENLGRAPGLSSSGGASLSLIISLGAFSIVRLAMLEKRSWYMSAIILIIFSQILVGRTGLLLSIFSLCLLLYYSQVNMKMLFATIVGLFLCQFIFIEYLVNNDQFLAYTMKWAQSSLTGGDGTMTALLDMGINEMDIKSFIIGTGQIATPSGLNVSGSDIGYIQTFYAMGLTGVAFYIVLFIFLYSYYRNTNHNLYYTVLLFLPFIVELKEPFIFKYMVVFYVFISLRYGEMNEIARKKRF